MAKHLFLALGLVGLLAACSQSQTPNTETPVVTTIDSFGVNPNPSPANVGSQFSWTVFGDSLTCKLDVDGNGTTDYTVNDCSSHSRVIHTYGSQGSFNARLTVTGADGKTVQQTASVQVTVPNTPPAIPSLTPTTPPGSTNPLAVRFAWVVNDFDSDITHCRFDADSDGIWEFDDLCSGLPRSSAVGKAATVTFTYNYTYPRQGRYNATLEAADPYVSTRTSVPVRVPWNRPPVIHTLKANSGPNLTATVGFSVSDPDGDPLICTLTLQGIGTFRYTRCTELSRTVTFPRDGTYKVTLEALDPYQGTDTRSTSLVFGGGGPPVIEGWTAVSAGRYHTCAVDGAGTAWCWGYNDYGQLGNGSTNDSYLPVKVTGGGLYTSVASGQEHACGLRSNGTVWCWGVNGSGQLGDGNTDDSSVPVQVGGGGTYTAISSGGAHNCGLRNDSTVWCWGGNWEGQLGNNDNTHTDSSVPVQVSGGGSYTAISSGVYFSCGLRNDSTLWCWGQNDYGQLGNGNTNQQDAPVQVAGGGTYISLGAGYRHSCGLRTGGVAWCWGQNDSGQLGNNSLSDSLSPVEVSGSHTFTQISSSKQNGSFSCGLEANGSIWCLGKNSDGRLGDNTTTGSQLPVQVYTTGLSGTRFQFLSTGDGHSCAIRDDYTLWCWGQNEYGKLGINPSTIYSAVPVNIPLP
jgi:alpha-tubulin suppressor-like RCC1 family protein